VLSFGVSLVLVQAIQIPNPSQLAERFAGMTAVAGYEQAMVDSLLALMPGAVRDRAGNAVVKLGTGSPKRLVACPIDEPGYVVGNVKEGKYLTVRRVGTLPSPLFDQWHEGRRVTVWSRSGPVPGVMAVPSTHLNRGGVPSTSATADELVIEVGAESPADLSALGVDLLSPVALVKAPHRYGKELLAAPSAGQRAACAALAAAILARPRPRGSVVAVFAVGSWIRDAGLFSAVNLHGPFDQTALVRYPLTDMEAARGAFGQVERFNLAAKYPGTPVETVALAEVEQIAQQIVNWIGGAP